MMSRDAVTWTTLSLAGEVDFHAPEVGSGELYGYDATSWQQVGVVPGGRPQALTATADTLLAATAGGIYRSLDGGRTFTSIDSAPSV